MLQAKIKKFEQQVGATVAREEEHNARIEALERDLEAHRDALRAGQLELQNCRIGLQGA